MGNIVGIWEGAEGDPVGVIEGFEGRGVGFLEGREVGLELGWLEGALG